MTNGELVSRISNQLRMITKDDYLNDRFVLHTALAISEKFITQKIKDRSLYKDMSVYKEIRCIEFNKVNAFSCGHIEFRNCKTLYKSEKSIAELGLIFTRYGSSIKELYSIDQTSTVLTESSLYQYRSNSKRQGGNSDPKYFYVLGDYIYITLQAETLSGIVLGLNQYEIENFCECSGNCDSVWDKEFISPSSQLEDVISYTIQNILQTKQIQPDENPNLSENSK